MRDEVARLTEALKSAERENIVLRGMVQRNGHWRCTYGRDIAHMTEYPLGFPGCGCADDLLLAQIGAMERRQT